MAQAVKTLVERIHQSTTRCAIITTGAGATAIAALMSVAGCSKTLVDAQVPYHPNASMKILDHFPQSFVSEQVGIELAQAAFLRCGKFTRAAGEIEFPFVGLGATAAIATSRSRKGQDCAFISCWESDRVTVYRLLLNKDDDRETQENLVSRVMLIALAGGAKVAFDDLDLQLPAIEPWRTFPLQAADQEPTPSLLYNSAPIPGHPFNLLLTGQVDHVLFNTHGLPRLGIRPYQDEYFDPTKAHYLLYPGTFNPLHWGHTELARVASKIVQTARDREGEERPVIVTYEVALSRVGKRDLTEEDLEDQLRQFTEGGHRVAMTTAKLFVDKARMFPHHGLVVGIDTVVRVLDVQYYGNSYDEMVKAMQVIRSYNCYFVVGGRLRGNEWVDLRSVKIPEEIQDMFIPIPQDLFRVDISSTEIRNRRQSPAPSTL